MSLGILPTSLFRAGGNKLGDMAAPILHVRWRVDHGWAPELGALVTKSRGLIPLNVNLTLFLSFNVQKRTGKLHVPR